MLLQVFITPQNVLAEGDKTLPQGGYVKVGEINAKSYDAKIMNELNRIAARNRTSSSRGPGVRLFSKGPYFGDNNKPKDADKPKYFGKVTANLDLKGLDGNAFQWNEIFGVDESGKPKPAQIIFRQMDDESSVDTGLYYMLQITKEGKYTWSDGEGKPTKLPLFSKSLKPYRYEVRIDERVSDKVELLTEVSFGTEGSSPTFLPENADGEIIANITLGLTYQQIASTKFKSEWHTGVAEAKRPGMKANFAFDDGGDDVSPVSVELPKNDKDTKIIRDWLNDFDPDLIMSYYLEKTPDVKIDENADGLTFDTTKKTVDDGNHKFKYDFTYDVINGGKLTMTEIIPITFDANGGKFDSLQSTAEQKIVKEVDYDGTLTDKADTPKKPGKAFKGWATDKEGKNPATETDYEKLKAAKTFYAIWSDEDIQFEELKTTESLGRFPKRGEPSFTNDFVPTFEELKAKVKVKNSNGNFVALPNDVTFSIVDDKGTEYTKNSDDLKKFIYEKVKEKNTDEVSRTEKVKAKVKYSDGTEREVEIPITVLKNIYKGSDEGNKYPHIPENYVKVTIDPTDKAQNPDKTYYYVNPKAKVVIPKEKDPVGAGENKFSKWTIKADGDTVESDYTFGKRQIYDKDHTITAQYGTGIIKIKYVDQNGNEIDPKYHKDGQNYSSEKSGGLGKEADELQFPSKGPDFKGYIYSSRDSIKGKYYKDAEDPDNLDIVKYSYFKKVTTEEPTNKNVYFKVIFHANGGKYGTSEDTQKDVYVYFDGNNQTVEKVTFDEVRQAVEEAYGKPIKENDIFVEWQDNAEEGKKVEDTYKIQFKGWDWDADPDNGYVPEVFYAHYGQASALVKYLDLDGKPIAEKYKIDGVDYPTEKAGPADQAIAKDVYTKDNAPKFTGYKFNRIELNPANGKYALDKKATIKFYYEKVPDVIPANPDGSNPDIVPDDYVRVEFVPTEKGSMDGDKVFFVNPKKEVTIPVNNPKAKATYTFKEWKLGENAEGEVYTSSTPKKFTQDTTITATYGETENIIPYDPSVPDPMPRPEGYVRVTFAADKGLSLTESKAYYVKKNAGITLGNEELKKPGYEVETGYKFVGWDKEDTLEIKEADIVVKANSTKLDNVIPEKDNEGNTNKKPDGYKEVTFVIKDDDKDKGSINGVAKFYVNPTEYVTINPPATEANTGYEFGTWDKDATIPTVYKEDTTIIGSFNGLKDVIPKTKTDDSEKPKGYVTVSFEIEGQGGKIVDGERKTYFVNPNKDVTINPPSTQAETGYVFEKWDQDTATAKKYTENTKVKGNFKKLDDIIPGTDGDGKQNPKPEAYVTLTFDKGEHGTLDGKTVYYVNPKAGKTLADITKPTVRPETGWKTDGWDKEDTLEIKDNTTVTAKYSPLDDVILKENPKGGENDKPEGYIKVSFNKGENGELEGNTVFYVNPNKAVVLEKHAPTIKPNTGYTSAGWDTSIDRAIQYKDGDVITAKYNPIGDVIPGDKDRPEGYVEVVFDKGEHGELSGTTNYWVKPDVEVTVPEPSVDPAIGYKFKDWDKSRTQKFTEDTKITAQYDSLENIIPGDQPQPKGYVTVEFKAEHGSLGGTTKYFVKPGVEVDLSDKADALTKNPDPGYTEVGGTWDKEIASKSYTKDETYKFTFEKLDDIIPATDETVKPNGYVTVKFVTNINGSLKGTTIYYVNPKAGITMGDKKIKAPKIIPNQGWEVKTPNWNPVYDSDTPVTEDKVYAANYEKLCVAEIKYISQNKEMGTVTNPSEEIGTGDLVGSTANPNLGYEFVEWVDTDGKQVSTDKKFVPEKRISAVYIAVFKEKGTVSEEVNKIWEDDVNPTPTMNFTLYRQAKGGSEEVVPDAEVIEITKAKTRASWTNLPKEDKEGKEYTYSVKEEFKDEDVKNDNWILGKVETDAKGNKTITNKLKTIPGENDTPDENKHRMAKLTITKKIASNPIKKVINFFRSAVEPLEFNFKITDPYGKEENFTLKAGETKEFNNLLYGDYTIEETDAKGLTPFVKVGDAKETKSSTAKVTLTKDVKTGKVEFTNKNEIPSNPNLTDIKATKIWSGGPSTDHKEVDLKLYRQVDGNEEKVKEKAQVSRDANNPSKFYYEWKNISKINDKGKEYSFRVEEANVTDNKVKVGENTYKVSQEGNTITNTYQVPQTEELKGQKIWEVPEGTQTPTIKLELWRKIADGKEERVTPAKELDQNDQVNFGKQAATDEAGNKYSYFVKEVDENGNPFNDSSYTSKVDRLTVTNTKVAEVAKDGKLTITKKLENEPKRISTFSTRSANSIKFKFEVTGPDNYKEEFDLGANESKSFGDLTHGKYFIKEIETQGYTPYFSLGNEEKQATEFEVEISSSEETKVTVTNKNVVNKNDLTVRATKIWKDGPTSDHKEVKVQLLRKIANEGEFEDVTKDYKLETLNNGTSDTITYFWKNLPKHDEDGNLYTYSVKELGVGKDKIYKVGDNSYKSVITVDEENTDNNTIAFDITNTFIKPEDKEDKKLIIATKKWEGVPDGTTKPEVYFQLYRKIEGSTIEESVGKPEELVNDEVNFGKLDKKDADGKEYTYFVKELNADGTAFDDANYTSEVNGLTVTNTYKAQEPEKDKFIDVVAYKKWESVPAGVEKPLVKFQLKRKTEKTEYGQAERVGDPVPVSGVEDEDGYISVKFTDLKEKDPKGNIYTYFVTELDEYNNELGEGAIVKASNGKDTYRVSYDRSCLYVTNTYKAGKPDVTPDPGKDPEDPGKDPDPGEEPKPNPDPEPKPNPEPNPTPVPEPEPKPDPNPVPEPEPSPEPQPNPGETPQPNPGVTPEPGEDPSDKPGKDPDNPGEEPSDKPGMDPEKPGEEPSDKPGEDPEKPGKDPEDKPGEDPEKPGEEPGDNPSKTPENPGEKPEGEPGKESGNKQARETNKKPGKTIENTAKKVVESVEKTVKTGVDSTKSLVKKAFNPRTGIFTNLDIYLGIMAASSVGLFVTRDKKEDE